ncbi:MAG: tRNA 2-thiouridine(34) synthase MnmA [Paludibacteraceae bacterium]|nr:tRNA 2-thiouridine(34) synthase MnmA [Paludibacteraceae bacterium]
MKKVLLGMSGGIDSTVSAMLLLEQGYEVVGVTFRTYDSIKESCLAKEKGCCTMESIMEAKHNAERMGFEHHIVDFRDTFRRCVIQDFIDEYMAGRTPNPCVLCNSTIKWGEMLHLADELGCDFIATGHYARIAERDGHMFLRTAADVRKDQTYFLWRLTEEQLRRTIFPLGDLTKDQVREIARQHGYEKLATKRESQEICFIPDNDYRAFLRANVPDYNERVRAGEYIDREGRVLGQHEGYVNYTIGQRKGLGIALGQPAYVTHIDAAANRVTLGTNDDLYATELRFRPVSNAFRPSLQGGAGGRLSLTAKVRYRSPAVPVKEIKSPITNHQSQISSLVFSEPIWGVTPGQSVVIYQDDLVLGGGIII